MSSQLSPRDELLAESVISWVFVFATLYAWGFPYTLGGLLLDKVLWPLTHYGQTLLPPSSNWQTLLQQNYLSAAIGIGALEAFELFGIPILYYLSS